MLRYTIKVFNTGNQDANPVVVTDTVPGNTVFDPDDVDGGMELLAGRLGGLRLLAVRWANLATGAHATVDLRGDPVDAALQHRLRRGGPAHARAGRTGEGKGARARPPGGWRRLLAAFIEQIFPLRGDANRAREMQATWRSFCRARPGVLDAGRSPPRSPINWASWRTTISAPAASR